MRFDVILAIADKVLGELEEERVATSNFVDEGDDDGEEGEETEDGDDDKLEGIGAARGNVEGRRERLVEDCGRCEIGHRTRLEVMGMMGAVMMTQDADVRRR